MERSKPFRPSGTRRGGEVDVCSGIGAACLAQTIKKFWAALGFDISIEVVQVVASKPPVYGIRSDLLGGLPRGTAK